MKIAQLAVYNTNLGDNIAIKGVRDAFEERFSHCSWEDVNLPEFHGIGNNPQKSIEKFKEIEAKNDVLVVGGCGLIEGNSASKHDTKWKLPFNDEVLSSLEIPIIVCGIGYNQFRGQKPLTKQGISSLDALIRKSKLFSVRNDGTYEALHSILDDSINNVLETADAGLIFNESDIHLRKSKLEHTYLNFVWNANPDIRTGRGMGKKNVKKLIDLGTRSTGVIHHTVKGFSAWTSRSPGNSSSKLFPGRAVQTSLGQLLLLKTERNGVTYGPCEFETPFSRTAEQVNSHYGADVDLVLAMHGHSQLISVGKNVPMLSISTQDKNLNFCKKYSFEEYCADLIEDPEPFKKLDDMIERIKTDKTYLEKWYNTRDECVKHSKEIFNSFYDKVYKVL